MRIYNVSRKMFIAQKAVLADTFISRMKGLLGRAELLPEEALVITHCRSIHMIGMKFPLDVIFVGKDFCVVGLVKNIQPNQLSPIFFISHLAIELASGTIQNTETAVGDQIQLL